MGFLYGARTGRSVTAVAVVWGTLAAVAPATSAAPVAASYSVIVQPEEGPAPVHRLIDSAKRSIDLTIFELTDRTAEKKLIARQKAGVRVRVILDQRKRQVNAPAYRTLDGGGVDVVWSDPRYYYTHQKSLVVDGRTALVMTGNLTPQRYARYRDYGIVDTDPADVAAIQRVFAADHAHASVTPGGGHHLVWSPTDARRQLLALIDRATANLSVECLAMSDTEIVHALAAAARRRVQVTVVMTNSDNAYARAFDTLTAAGARVSTYAPSATPYIHAKVIVADRGTRRERVFIGSENFSRTSLDKNRELGVILPDRKAVARVASVIARDHAGGTPWKKKAAADDSFIVPVTAVDAWS
ncbi:phospholipase D-like domain-containing protein [Streptomyces sp. NPDC053048]|uniref:phospholipase D-like domain-containing protein n=1 Tax=Streptomyces sp. NPDC053048 TaxID=3365694 RepID=UPI0037CE2CEF